MNTVDKPDQSQVPAEPIRPSLLFEKITFSDGTTLDIGTNDIVVFVGPNNAGKSAALRELEGWIARSNAGVVIKSAELVKTGNSRDLKSYLEENSHKSGNDPNFSYAGLGYNIHNSHVSFFDQPLDRHPVAPFFARRLPTETRIQDSNPASMIALHQEPPTHPTHMLLMDEILAADLSKKFKHAFGVDLTPFRAGGGKFPLYVGNKPILTLGRDELSRDFVMELQRTNVPLDQQGDGMRSFASVLLHVMASNTHSIQFLDEPEAFLHPPQARLLGRYIAETRREHSQLFISTHSADILDGLIDGGLSNVRIVRIRREGPVNRVKELGNEQTKAVARDTLIRFSRVFDGIFFDNVIICESDADCMFYQSLLELRSISGERKPDVLFVHTAGKHRMVKLAETLRALDVPVSVIADIDMLNEESPLEKLITALGGEWSVIKPTWKALSTAITARRPPLNAGQVVQMIEEQIDGISGMGEFPAEKVREIKRVLSLSLHGVK